MIFPQFQGYSVRVKYFQIILDPLELNVVASWENFGIDEFFLKLIHEVAGS